MGLFKRKKPFRLSIRNRSLAFTPLGTRTVFVCIAVGAAAINTGSNLLYLTVAMLLSMILLSGVLSEQALRRLVPKRRLPSEMYAGTPFPVVYTLRNNKRRMPSLALSVASLYPGGQHGPAAFLARVGPGEEGDGRVSEAVAHRGEWLSSGFEISTRFPFGFFVKTLRVPHPETRLVYPQVRPLGQGMLDTLTAGLGEAPAQRKGHGQEIRGLRYYLPTDEARIIHWKSSARLSVLMAKEFEAQEKEGVTVILDNFAPERPGPDYAGRFEEAVVLAASVVHHLLFTAEAPVSFMSRGMSIGPGTGRGHFMLLMETLARIKPVHEEGPEDALLDAFREGTCVLVLADNGSGWARHKAGAALVLEAG